MMLEYNGIVHGYLLAASLITFVLFGQTNGRLSMESGESGSVLYWDLQQPAVRLAGCWQ